MAELTTSDGVPLKVSLNRTLRARKRTALLLVAPLFLFILITFLGPIFDMLSRSVDNDVKGSGIISILPKTSEELKSWDETSGNLPDEIVFKTFIEEVQIASENRTINKVGKRLNYEKSGSFLCKKIVQELEKMQKYYKK